MEGLDLNSPIVGVVVGIVAGAALIALSHRAKGLPEPVAGIVRLQAGEVSFTEIFGMFVLGYGIGALVNGPTSTAGGPPGPPGVVVRRLAAASIPSRAVEFLSGPASPSHSSCSCTGSTSSASCPIRRRTSR